METRKGQERKASHILRTVWSPLTQFHPHQRMLKKGCSRWYWTWTRSMMHYRELWIKSATGKTLLWITSSSIRSLFLSRKYPTSTCPEGLRYPKSFFFFSGSEDPVEYLDNFRSHVSLHKTPDAVVCRVFPFTLLGKARDWLRNLPPRSIDNFDTLGRKFLAQFMSGRTKRKPRRYLLSVQ
jgi:hypothetical protein